MALLLLAGNAGAQALSPAEAAGKRLYVQGIGASGDAPRARVGAGGLNLPASALPCVNCHGDDGHGRPEGGVVPPDITWAELSKSYGHVHPNGRRHGPFDAAGLRRAVVEGLDPAGNRLDDAMPRYVLGANDLAHLQAYLQRLGNELDPGLDAKRIRIGTLLPLSGGLAEAGQSVRALLEAYVAGVNARGGIYGRQVELVVAEYGDDASANLGRVRGMLEGEGVFALLSPFAAGFERELTDLARQRRVPVIAPVSLELDDRADANSHVFHLLSGGTQLAQVLGDHAIKFLDLRAESIALLHPDTREGRSAAQRVSERFAERGYKGVRLEAFKPGAAKPAELAARLKQGGIEALILLGLGLDPIALAQAADALGWHPQLLLPGPFAPPGVLGLPSGFDSRIFLAYPSLPTDRKPQPLADYTALLKDRKLAPGLHPTLAASYSGAALLVEALKRAGRELSRQKLMAALESGRDFDAGLVPVLTYNTTRRIGAYGGYVVSVDLARQVYRPIGQWVRLD